MVPRRRVRINSANVPGTKAVSDIKPIITLCGVCLGEKKLMADEFYPIYSQVLKDKDQGVYEDFIECLKLYDKAEDGHMIGGELTHILLSLGKCKYLL